MLARYLHAVPVRYAAQDALRNLRLAMALRNLLHVQTRAHDLPHFAHLSQGQLPHPAMPEMLRDIFGRHDPRTVGQLLDLHEETTGQQGPGSEGFIFGDETDPMRSLFDYLHMLHSVASGQSQYLPHHEIQQRYGTLHQDIDNTFPNVLHAAHGAVSPHADDIRSLMLHLGRIPFQDANEGALRHMFEGLRSARAGALGGSVPDLLNLYDALHNVATHPMFGSHSTANHAAHSLRSDLAQSMRTTLLPALHEGL